MRKTLIAGLALFMALPAVSMAQRDDQFVFGIGGGATFPTGVANDLHTVGAHGMASWGIGMVDSRWGIRFDGTYSSLGGRSSNDAVPGQAAITQGDAKVFILSGSGVVNLYGSNTHVYMLGGLGGFWYNPEGSGRRSKNDLALQAGLGVFLPVMNSFIEVKFVNLYRALPNTSTGVQGKKSAKLIPVTLGILF
ncbi:MAG TPA: hypothetical protein VF042_07165 [Gemmatimonadaceae bacterium]